MYAIYPSVYTSRHYGNFKQIKKNDLYISGKGV